jgi:nucleoside-diphosphate-sugar epimerase
MRKKLDNSLAKKYGWSPKIDLNNGLEKVLESFIKIKN